MGAEDFALGWLIHNTIGGPEPSGRAPTPGEWNCMTRGISANIELMQQAADYVASPAAAATDYLVNRLRFEVGGGGGYLGQNETLSPTYGEWHLGSWLAVNRAAHGRSGDDHAYITMWSHHLLDRWFALLERMCMWGLGQPQTQYMHSPAIASPGMRCQPGHPGSPVLARMLAIAAQVDPWDYTYQQQELDAYKAKPWWDMARVMKWSEWRASWRYQDGTNNDEIRAVARQARLPVKLTIFRGTDHEWIASIMDRNINNNTPPCMAAMYEPAKCRGQVPGRAYFAAGGEEALPNTYGLDILQPAGWTRPVKQPSEKIRGRYNPESDALEACDQYEDWVGLALPTPPVEAATEVYGT